MMMTILIASKMMMVMIMVFLYLDIDVSNLDEMTSQVSEMITTGT